MPRVCEKCKSVVSVVTKDIDSSMWLCKNCLGETRKKKQKRIPMPMSSDGNTCFHF